ncbi:hypothetical protein COOONC_15462 [Cooperia oncophora]
MIRQMWMWMSFVSLWRCNKVSMIPRADNTMAGKGDKQFEECGRSDPQQHIARKEEHSRNWRFDAPHPIRTRRQTCKTKSSLELNQVAHDFGTHCERDNICLRDEDSPSGPQRDGFKELHAARAKKYSAYLTQLSRCYGRL